MITAISNFNGHNSKVNSANYNSSNETRKANNSSQVIDSFANSKQVSFKGNPMALVKGKGKLAKVSEGFLAGAGKKVDGIAKRVGEEATEVIGSTARKLKGKTKTVDHKKLPKPQIFEYGAYSSPVISKIIRWNSKHPGHKIPVPAENINSATAAERTLNEYIKKYDPSFTGLADLVPDAAKETTTKVGSAVASSAAGETVKTVASETGQFIAEEVVGEAGMQAIERAIDCVIPGFGGLITVARWGRRIYKAGKIIDKL